MCIRDRLTGGTHSFTIAKRAISVNGTRLYDATSNAEASDLSTQTNLVGSQTLVLSGTGIIASRDVGSNKTVSVGTLTLADGSNGGLAANYTLSGGTHQLTVTQRPLNSSGSKAYDANTDALANAITLSNLAGGETLVHSGTASTSSANAGSYTINLSLIHI